MSKAPANASRWTPYVPKLYTAPRLGYRLDDFRHDLIAGLTVAVVALPLATALAIASGTTPQKSIQPRVILMQMGVTADGDQLRFADNCADALRLAMASGMVGNAGAYQ